MLDSSILNPIRKSNMNINDYQEAAVKTAIYNREKYSIMYPSMGLAGECGEILNKVKKVYRDNDGQFSEETKRVIASEIGDSLWYIATLADDLGFDLESIAAANIAKLNSRKERGVISGSGDER